MEVAMAKRKWEQDAVKHPGVEKRAAARAGKSVHAYMEKHKNDPGTAGRRARLGLRFEKQAAAKKRKRKSS
jgi:hypothetical protein